MGVVVTTGAVRRAKFQSNCHHQQTNTQCFTGRMPFLSPNHQCQSTEGKISHSTDLVTPSSALTTKGSWLPWGSASHQPSDASTPECTDMYKQTCSQYQKYFHTLTDYYYFNFQSVYNWPIFSEAYWRPVPVWVIPKLWQFPMENLSFHQMSPNHGTMKMNENCFTDAFLPKGTVINYSSTALHLLFSLVLLLYWQMNEMSSQCFDMKGIWHVNILLQQS